MTKEDLEFLKELQHELKTQETDGQRSPRFWGVMETKESIVPTGYGEYQKVIDRTGESIDYTVEEYVDLIDKILEEDDEVTEEDREAWAKIDRGDIYDVIDFARECLGRKTELLEFKKNYVLSDQTGCFLTKRAVKKHIELNSHHYCNPHTFAMTAWRNPEFEKFLKIFENLDLNKLETIIEEDV